MKSIGEIIKAHRIEKNMSQEELGKKLFVTKQAVSKWENGKTLPDIETIRKLTDILSIPHDEILGETMRQTKQYRSWVRLLIPLVGLLFCMTLFFAFDGVGIIQRRMQSGIAIVVLYENGSVVDSSRYQVADIARVKSGEYGYSFGIDYGEVKGRIITDRHDEIEFGFFNTNSWHNVQIHIDIDTVSGSEMVTQSVVYKTDNDRIEALDSKAFLDRSQKVSVYKGGV